MLPGHSLDVDGVTEEVPDDACETLSEALGPMVADALAKAESEASLVALGQPTQPADTAGTEVEKDTEPEGLATQPGDNLSHLRKLFVFDLERSGNTHLVSQVENANDKDLREMNLFLTWKTRTENYWKLSVAFCQKVRAHRLWEEFLSTISSGVDPEWVFGSMEFSDVDSDVQDWFEFLRDYHKKELELELPGLIALAKEHQVFHCFVSVCSLNAHAFGTDPLADYQKFTSWLSGASAGRPGDVNDTAAAADDFKSENENLNDGYTYPIPKSPDSPDINIFLESAAEVWCDA